MNRNLKIIVVADPATQESRDLLEQINSQHLAVETSVVTPALVRRIIPIRANPAVGVMFWATDLQGLASDVEAFADYIKNESANKQAIADAADVAQAYIDLLVGDEEV